MFTGIVEHVGVIVGVERLPDLLRLRIDLGPQHGKLVEGGKLRRFAENASLLHRVKGRSIVSSPSTRTKIAPRKPGQSGRRNVGFR